MLSTRVIIGAAGGGVVPPPSPTIAFRSLSSVSYSTRNLTTTVPPPAGIVDGDILYATFFIGAGAPPPVPIPHAGWTMFGTATAVSQGGFFGDLYVFWKRADNESGSYDFDYAGSNNTQCAIAAYSGCVASGSPLNATANNTGTGTTTTGLSITTTQPNSWLLLSAHDWTAGGGITPPTGMTERFESLIYVADELIAAAGATGNRVFTNSNSGGSDPWAARMVELLYANAPIPVVLSYSLKSTDITIENNDLTAVMAGPGGDNAMGAANTFITAGKKNYFEFDVVNDAGASTGAGIVRAGASYVTGQWLGLTTFSVGYYSNGDVYINYNSLFAPVANYASFAAGDVIGIAVDRDAGLIWFRVNGGDWNDNPSADPTTGVGGLDYGAVLGVVDVAPGYNVYQGGAPASDGRVNFAPVVFADPAPSGYTAI